MNLPPMTVARYGVYLAAFASVMSIYLGYQAGATLDFKILKVFGTAGFGEFTTYSAGLRVGL